MYKYRLYLIALVSLIIISCNKPVFDKNIWNKDPSRRRDMVDDLTENILPNKSKQDIINILGEPNRTYFANQNKLTYPLGLENSLFAGIDYEWLIIKLDSNGIYVEYEIKTD